MECERGAWASSACVQLYKHTTLKLSLFILSFLISIPCSRSFFPPLLSHSLSFSLSLILQLSLYLLPFSLPLSRHFLPRAACIKVRCNLRGPLPLVSCLVMSCPLIICLTCTARDTILIIMYLSYLQPFTFTSLHVPPLFPRQNLSVSLPPFS